MNTKQNLHISSKLHLVGGEYRQVHISGSATFAGDLKCDSFQTSGKAVLEQNLMTERFFTSGSTVSLGALSCVNEMKISGKANIEKSVQTKELFVSGTLQTNGMLDVEKMKISGRTSAKSIKAEEIYISGSATVLESLQTQELAVSGILKVANAIEAENIKVSGRLNCEGLMSGERIKLESLSSSTFKEIGATQVEITRSSVANGVGMMVGSVLNSIMGGLSPLKKISGDLIEADDVRVEYAEIKKVSGHDIVIGPECVIDEVEYSGSLKVDESSVVRQQVKL